MTANTAKAIKEIIRIMTDGWYVDGDQGGLSRFHADDMERALIEFAESVKLDAIEP